MLWPARRCCRSASRKQLSWSVTPGRRWAGLVRRDGAVERHRIHRGSNGLGTVTPHQGGRRHHPGQSRQPDRHAPSLNCRTRTGGWSRTQGIRAMLMDSYTEALRRTTAGSMMRWRSARHRDRPGHHHRACPTGTVRATCSSRQPRPVARQRIPNAAVVVQQGPPISVRWTCSRTSSDGCAPTDPVIASWWSTARSADG